MKPELHTLCRYYRGESEPPADYTRAQRMFWRLERLAFEDEEDAGTAARFYLEAGEPGRQMEIPGEILAAMFMRYCYQLDTSPQEAAGAFVDCFLPRYLVNTPHQGGRQE